MFILPLAQFETHTTKARLSPPYSPVISQQPPVGMVTPVSIDEPNSSVWALVAAGAPRSVDYYEPRPLKHRNRAAVGITDFN